MTELSTFAKEVELKSKMTNELGWVGVRNSMASKDQCWKKNRSKLFFVGFGLLTCLAKYLNLKENSPCFLLLFVFSFSRCTIPI